MKGGEGYVGIDITENDHREVTLETKEWEYQAKQFAEQRGR